MICRPSPPPGWVAPAGGVDGGWVRLVTARGAALGDEAATADDPDGGRTALMRRAAGHLARGVLDVAGGGYGRRVVVLVGKGDNGGDGWAAAPLLRAAGARVTVVAVAGTDTDASAATTHFRSRWLASGGPVRTGPDGLADLLAHPGQEGDVVVDCLLGTGTAGAPQGVVAAAVAAVHEARARTDAPLPVVACDVPTGVDADSGAVPGTALSAVLTVTFGAAKQGLLLHPAADHVGRLVVGALGPAWPVLDRGWAALTAAGAAPAVAASGAEKRSRGVALAVAGSRGAAGAAALCSRGLLVGGAGLVTVAVPAVVQHDVAALVPAAMTLALPDDDEGAVQAKATRQLSAGEHDVVVAGPGLTPSRATRKVVDHLLSSAERLVLDADALNAYRGEADGLRGHRGTLVLTPHARELARLVGRDVVDDHGDRRAPAARELAERVDAVVVAKGPRTIVAAPDGRTWVTPTGGPALATGGTGDVLAGLVAAAVAVADDVPLAVARAVWQHGFAGDLGGRRHGGRLTAEALVDHVPSAMQALVRLAQRRPAWPLDGCDRDDHDHDGGGVPDER